MFCQPFFFFFFSFSRVPTYLQRALPIYVRLWTVVNLVYKGTFEGQAMLRPEVGLQHTMFFESMPSIEYEDLTFD